MKKFIYFLINFELLYWFKECFILKNKDFSKKDKIKI